MERNQQHFHPQRPTFHNHLIRTISPMCSLGTARSRSLHVSVLTAIPHIYALGSRWIRCPIVTVSITKSGHCCECCRHRWHHSCAYRYCPDEAHANPFDSFSAITAPDTSINSFLDATPVHRPNHTSPFHSPDSNLYLHPSVSPHALRGGPCSYTKHVRNRHIRFTSFRARGTITN